MAVVTGTLGAVGGGSAFSPLDFQDNEDGKFNFTLTGTFGATVQLQRSFDNGVTWVPVTNLGASVSFTGPCTEVCEEPEDGVLYRAYCAAYTSGTIAYRLSQ